MQLKELLALFRNSKFVNFIDFLNYYESMVAHEDLNEDENHIQ